MTSMPLEARAALERPARQLVQRLRRVVDVDLEHAVGGGDLTEWRRALGAVGSRNRITVRIVSRPPSVDGGPSATISPRAITATRSARNCASSMKCVVRNTVLPSAVRLLTSSHAWRRALGSNPVVGSSRKSSSGSPARPIATSSRRC